MNIGYFKFNSKEEAKRKEERFKRIKDIEKVFAGDSDESFFEFIDGINAENNIVIITSLADIGMTIGLLPITGITLPFVSYGGSSLLITMVSIGIILNISRYQN